MVDSHMFLGIYLDSKLNFKTHINHLSSKISKTICIMYRLRNYMPSDTLKMLYVSLVQSYLNYCATVWGAAYFSNIKPVFILQKKIIRIITNSDYIAPSMPLFEQLRILNIFDLCKFNTLKFFYKIFNGNHESFLYFKRLLSDEQVENHYNLRSVNVRGPFADTNRCRQAVLIRGTSLWNSLPNEIKMIQSFNVFKNKLFDHFCSSYT